MAEFAPGMRVLIRDEEWMIRKCDPNSFKTYTLQCVGVSPLVRDEKVEPSPFSSVVLFSCYNRGR